MMRNSNFRFAIQLGALLMLSHFRTTICAPIAAVTVDIVKYESDNDCDPEPESLHEPEPTETVLQSSNGQVYVPLTTFTKSIPYTANGLTTYSTIVLTSYFTTTTTTYTDTSSSSAVPVLSTKEADTSFYTLSLSSELTSLTSSAVQTPWTSVTAHTTAVRILFF